MLTVHLFAIRFVDCSAKRHNGNANFIKKEKNMNQTFRRLTAILLALVMLSGAFSALAVQAFAAEESEDVKKGEFTFAPHTYTEGDLTDIYYYTDAVFSESATDYNEHLATMSMIMAAASISSQEKDATYEVKSNNLRYLFKEWGFSGFAVNEYYTQRPGEQTMGVGIAYKVIGEGENAYTLLAIVPRSAGYEKEWAGNFTVGKEGVHEGFATGRDIILDFAKKYVEEQGDQFEGEVKVWTMGYSRGAGVANLLAAYLDDNNNALGVETKKENIFAYTFGTPSTIQFADEAEKALLESNYRNIHNRYSDYDIVTYAPFKEWDFTCYGTTKLFDVYNAENKAEMLTFLEKTNKTIYDLYVAENSSANPDNFLPLMLQLDLSDGVKTSFVPADPAYGIPTNQKDFLDSRVKFLAEHLVPDRATYVDGGYQYALQCLTSLYFGLNGEQSSLLIGGMSHDAKMMAGVYYCYFVSDFYLSKTGDLAFAARILIDSLPMIEEMMGNVDSAEELAPWMAFAAEFMQTPEYEELKTLLPTVASGAEIAMDKISAIRNTIKSFAVGMTAKVLEGGVSALTIDAEEKAELLTKMTDPAVTAPLTEFLIYLLLGSEEGVTAPFNPSNKNIALAVTFFANAGRYMRVHNNEIILSWLRTEDSYYENEDWHIHETDTEFDANGHWLECECGYKSKVVSHALGEWPTIPVKDGEKDVLIRRCSCGYEERKDAPVKDPAPAPSSNTLTIVLICVGSAVVVVAAAVTTVVVVKKRKSKK